MPWFRRALGVIVIDLLFCRHLLLSSSSETLSLQLLTHEASTKGDATSGRGTSGRTLRRHLTSRACRVPVEFSMALLVGKPLYFPMVKPSS